MSISSSTLRHSIAYALSFIGIAWGVGMCALGVWELAAGTTDPNRAYYHIVVGVTNLVLWAYNLSWSRP